MFEAFVLYYQHLICREVGLQVYHAMQMSIYVYNTLFPLIPL